MQIPVAVSELEEGVVYACGMRMTALHHTALALTHVIMLSILLELLEL